LGLADQLGTLTVGKKADLVLYDLTNLSLLPRTDPIGLLVLGRPSQAVDSAWVNGQQVIAEGKVATIDVDQLRQDLFSHSHWQTQRASQTMQSLESRYRSVMGLG
jgi:cytosine/adenosine deaminase-related metal-dependent hydrolase